MIAIMRLRTFVHPVLCTGRQYGEQGSISVRFARPPVFRVVGEIAC